MAVIAKDIDRFVLADTILSQQQPFTIWGIKEILMKQKVNIDVSSIQNALNEMAEQLVVIDHGSYYSINNRFFNIR